MENRAEFRLGKRIFLGILGNLGSEIDPQDLSQKDQSFGFERTRKTRQDCEREERNEPFPWKPSHPIYSKAGLPRYAGRTFVRSAYAYVMHDRSLDCLGFGWDGLLGTRVGWDGGSDGSDGSALRTGQLPRIWRRGRSEAKSLGYAGRTGVRSAYPDEDADSSSDKTFYRWNTIVETFDSCLGHSGQKALDLRFEFLAVCC
ncbi:hypothetical protein Lser_V15G14285 [Lactuca serriola]